MRCLLLVLLATALAACSSPGSGTVSPDDSGEADAVDAAPDIEVDGTDEDPVSACDDPDGDGYGPGCPAGDDCVPDDATSHPGVEERCGDGLDNNCDGEVDEDCGCLDGQLETCWDGDPSQRDVGVCASGFRACSDGAWGACEGQVLPEGASETACDGRDEDCDGQVDEGLVNACGACGPLDREVCDLLDNDCDGEVDEDADCDCDDRTNQPCYGGPPSTLGRGQCRGGVADCVDGAWQTCVGEVLPLTEICDGLDNDCDGFVDEGLRNACGDCADAVPDEICDGLDNDCDGQVDEGVRLVCGRCPGDVVEEGCGNGLDDDCDGVVDEGCPCTTGEATCYPGPAEVADVGECRSGTRACSSGGEVWGPCEGYVLPTIEVCDGLDNDCDGTVDRDANGCSLCTTELEICDGLDNDCDGDTDEGLRNPCGVCFDDVVQEELGGPELCDGEDNDCDGLIDEGLVNACGTCDESCYVADYDEPDEWLEGELEGIDPDNLGDGLTLGRARFTYPDLWVANASDGTVTRIDTRGDTPSVVGTYPVGVSPSRTAVDFNGDVWIANRAFDQQGTVTKVSSTDCTGDACVIFTVDVGEFAQTPRGLAIDRDGFAWVGTYGDGMLYRLHPETGAVVESVPTGLSIYGLAIDSEGVIWIATISGQGIGAFDTETGTMLGNWPVPGCSAPYGIAVDGDGNVWVGNWTCHDLVRLDRAAFDDGEVSFRRISNPMFNRTRGVAVDGEGDVYVAASGTNRLAKFDVSEDDWAWTAETCNSPIGVGIASDGNIWVMCYDADQAQRFTPDGEELGGLPTGTNPYSYSDMTGFQLRNFTAPRGVWRTVFDCGYDVCTFDEVAWSAVLPSGTTVTARARTGFDLTSFAGWSDWSAPADASPAVLDLPDGRYCQVEVTLATADADLTPVVESVEVRWQRP